VLKGLTAGLLKRSRARGTESGRGLLEPRMEIEGRDAMGRHSKTISIGILMAVCCVLTPAGASAGSLLSGYGGPGQGNQAILGSVLLGGASGGQGGSTGAGGGGSVAGGLGNGPADSTGAARRRSAAPGESRKHRKAAVGTPAAAGSEAQSDLLTRPAAAAGTVPGQTLGLSADDLVYIILVLGALGLMGGLTRQLARSRGAAAKGTRRRTRVSN
jgi:hypothetical protein